MVVARSARVLRDSTGDSGQRTQRDTVRTVSFRHVPLRDHLLANRFAGRVAMVRINTVVPRAVNRQLARTARARRAVRQIDLEYLGCFESPRRIEIGDRGETFVVTRRIEM